MSRRDDRWTHRERRRNDRNNSGTGCPLQMLLLLPLLPVLLPLLAVLSALAKAPRERDTGERPEGYHVGYRWRTNPPGSWWPRGDDSEPDDSQKVQPGRWRRATREQR